MTFDAAPVLAGLKDCQRRTVDHVFDRMYGESPTTRFLVADEVGLGKTFVAKGLIAKTIEHLEASVERIDVVYVCSNAAIADQNIRRLKVMDEGFVRSTRLTLLAKDLRDMDQKRVNFLSLTPATAFGPESARADWALGRADERAIIFHMLRDIFSDRRSALRLLLQGYSEDKGWSREIDKINQSDLDKGVIKAFQAKVETNVELWRELGECLELFGRSISSS